MFWILGLLNLLIVHPTSVKRTVNAIEIVSETATENVTGATEIKTGTEVEAHGAHQNLLGEAGLRKPHLHPKEEEVDLDHRESPDLDPDHLGKTVTRVSTTENNWDH